MSGHASGAGAVSSREQYKQTDKTASQALRHSVFPPCLIAAKQESDKNVFASDRYQGAFANRQYCALVAQTDRSTNGDQHCTKLRRKVSTRGSK